MRKSINFFDCLYFFAILSSLFVLGFHLGKEKISEEKEKLIITVRLEKSRGEPEENSTVLIDGKYECIVTNFDGESVSFLCEGNFYEAGFLIGGTKYIAKNQPIKASRESIYIEGRISHMDKAEYKFMQNTENSPK